jgi:hypothetical protein
LEKNLPHCLDNAFPDQMNVQVGRHILLDAKSGAANSVVVLYRT